MMCTLIEVIAAFLMGTLGVNYNYYLIETAVPAIKGMHEKEVLVIMAIESSFNPNATSGKGAKGLMQLTDIAVKHVVDNQLCDITKTPPDLYDIKANVEIGSCYFSHLMLSYNYNRTHALIAYNGGSKAVEAYKRGEPYAESVNYLKKFETLWNTLKH